MNGFTNRLRQQRFAKQRNQPPTQRLLCWLAAGGILAGALLLTLSEQAPSESRTVVYLALALLLLWRLLAWAPALYLGKWLCGIARRMGDSRLWRVGELCALYAHDHAVYQLLAACFGRGLPRIYCSRCPRCSRLVDPFVPGPEAARLHGGTAKCPRCHKVGSYRLVENRPSES